MSDSSPLSRLRRRTSIAAVLVLVIIGTRVVLSFTDLPKTTLLLLTGASLIGALLWLGLSFRKWRHAVKTAGASTGPVSAPPPPVPNLAGGLQVAVLGAPGSGKTFLMACLWGGKEDPWLIRNAGGEVVDVYPKLLTLHFPKPTVSVSHKGDIQIEFAQLLDKIEHRFSLKRGDSQTEVTFINVPGENLYYKGQISVQWIVQAFQTSTRLLALVINPFLWDESLAQDALLGFIASLQSAGDETFEDALYAACSALFHIPAETVNAFRVELNDLVSTDARLLEHARLVSNDRKITVRGLDQNQIEPFLGAIREIAKLAVRARETDNGLVKSVASALPQIDGKPPLILVFTHCDLFDVFVRNVGREDVRSLAHKLPIGRYLAASQVVLAANQRIRIDPPLTGGEKGSDRVVILGARYESSREFLAGVEDFAKKTEVRRGREVGGGKAAETQGAASTR